MSFQPLKLRRNHPNSNIIIDINFANNLKTYYHIKLSSKMLRTATKRRKSVKAADDAWKENDSEAEIQTSTKQVAELEAELNSEEESPRKLKRSPGTSKTSISFPTAMSLDELRRDSTSSIGKPVKVNLIVGAVLFEGRILAEKPKKLSNSSSRSTLVVNYSVSTYFVHIA